MTAPAPSIDSRPPVRRRRVFYISGFDPRGPGHYHQLYRTEAEKQGRVTGQRLNVGQAERVDRLVTRWRITDEAHGTTTDYDFLRWDDLVRANWTREPLQNARSYVAAHRNMSRGQVMRRSRQVLTLGGYLTLVFPFWALVASAVAPVLALGFVFWLMQGLGTWAALGGAAVAAVACWWSIIRFARSLNAEWMMHMVTFCDRAGNGALPGLTERLDAFAQRVRAALDDPELDEVLVASHSLGAPLGVEVMARCIAPSAPPDARLSFLTFGQAIPLISLIPGAASLRSALTAVGSAPAVHWIDVSATPDYICYAFCDPLASCGLPPTGKPYMMSARFHKQFTPLRYRLLRLNRYRLHFQYLMAGELKGGFDYFHITAGPQPFSALKST